MRFPKSFSLGKLGCGGRGGRGGSQEGRERDTHNLSAVTEFYKRKGTERKSCT